MNILYIGPFQQNNDLGYCSSAILRHLCSLPEHKTFAYPIYSGYDNTLISNIPYFRFKELTHYPDINIQHCNIEHLYIDQYSRNYFIPIHNLDSSIPTKYLNKLNSVDKIIVYNDFDYQKYIDIGIDNNLLVKMESPQVEASDKKLDIGIYQQYYKYYFIGDFESNSANIFSVIYSFLSITKKNKNICLVICSECNSQQKQQLISTYEDIKKKLCLQTKEDKVLFVIDNISIDTIQKIHNTCDCFVCLNNSHYPLTDISIAKSCKNSIIDYSNIVIDTQNYNYDSYKYIPTQKSLRYIFSQNNLQHITTYPTQSLNSIL